MKITRSALLLHALVWILSIGSTADVRAGVEDCIDPTDACDEPCPSTTCSIDADCPSGEVCVVSSSTCCASSSCSCIPETGEWACTADCMTGVNICVEADSQVCVPALSEVGIALLALSMAAAMTVALRQRQA